MPLHNSRNKSQVLGFQYELVENVDINKVGFDEELHISNTHQDQEQIKTLRNDIDVANVEQLGKIWSTWTAAIQMQLVIQIQ